jgi:hypothetical protein
MGGSKMSLNSSDLIKNLKDKGVGYVVIRGKSVLDHGIPIQGS